MILRLSVRKTDRSCRNTGTSCVPCLQSRTFMTIGGLIVPSQKQVQTYESLYIVRPNLDEDAVDKVVSQVDEYIKGLGGTIVATDKKGRRRLAYEVQKMRDGYYVLTVFTAKPEAVAALKRMMALSEDIIRNIVVVHEEEPWRNDLA